MGSQGNLFNLQQQHHNQKIRRRVKEIVDSGDMSTGESGSFSSYTTLEITLFSRVSDIVTVKFKKSLL